MCTIDDQEIGTDPYFSWNNQIYCERHYNELFSPQCAKCGVSKSCNPFRYPIFQNSFHITVRPKIKYFLKEPILENMINAMGKSYHQRCFTCATCDKPFTDSFHEHEGWVKFPVLPIGCSFSCSEIHTAKSVIPSVLPQNVLHVAFQSYQYILQH